MKDSQSLDLYLQEIGEADLLTAEEEQVLARRIREGDEKALDTLVRANLRFVVSIAKQYQHLGLSLPDLISEGNIGLIKAARRFDETRGYKFISYAVWWVRQAILRALAEQSRLIRLPLNKVEELRRINRTIKRREMAPDQGQGESQSAADPEGPPDMMPEWASTPLSLDAPIGEQDRYNLLDRLRDQSSTMPDEALMDKALKHEVGRAVASLAPREREVLDLYFGLNSDRGHTLKEIGSRFGMTREGVRQIKQRAINKLRHSSRGHRLIAYLE